MTALFEGRRPAYQFYPGDEEQDPGVQMLSLAAFGLWRRLLNRMHTGVPYGHLTIVADRPMTLEQIARVVGGERKTVVKRLLSELEEHKVFSKTDAGVIYSRRMVKDERNRIVRAAGGARSLENPNVPRPKDGAERTPTRTGERIPERIPSEGPSGGSLGGSPSSSPPSSPSSSQQEVGGSAAVALTDRANQGLAAHATQPQPRPPLVATKPSTFEAVEAILVAGGVPLDFAASVIYEIARTHNADGGIASLKYFVRGTLRAWAQHQADAASATSTPPAPVANGTNGHRAPRRSSRRPGETPQAMTYSAPTESAEAVKWQD